MTSSPPNIVNFGCRLNLLEADQIREAAGQAGVTNTTIINSCAVTHEAVRQARQAARRAKRDNPDHRVIMTGCAAQIDAQQFQEVTEIDQVLGNDEKMRAESYQSQATHLVGDIMAQHRARTLPIVPQRRARAFVQVQNGCDHRCTFCIIPFGRGPSRSVPAADIIRQCQSLVDAGHREIVLTGVDITSWGPDLGEDGLGTLVGAVLNAVPSLERLRLSSLDAVELDPAFLDLVIHEPRLMPHLHLSLQAGDDMILKRMKRRHSRAQAIAFCEKLKMARPEIVFGADLIAGFPTETEAMFENTRQLIAECGLIWLHVFPYSERPDTPAARMPQVDKPIITDRANRLRETGDALRQHWLKTQIGSRYTVLMETETSGRAENFARVQLDSPQEVGSICTAQIVAVDGEQLKGALIAAADPLMVHEVGHGPI
jgi:threonylcarbamoyladenosine tRNA methylthiotransferase MtaB